MMIVQESIAVCPVVPLQDVVGVQEGTQLKRERTNPNPLVGIVAGRIGALGKSKIFGTVERPWPAPEAT